MKFMIAIPAYGGSIKNGCVESLLKLQASLHARGVSADYGVLNIAGIPEARNYYASILLQRAEHSHILFVDSDMAFDPAVFWKLVDAQKPLVGCIYPKRNASRGGHRHGPLPHSGRVFPGIAQYRANRQVPRTPIHAARTIGSPSWV